MERVCGQGRLSNIPKVLQLSVVELDGKLGLYATLYCQDGSRVPPCGSSSGERMGVGWGVDQQEQRGSSMQST